MRFYARLALQALRRVPERRLPLQVEGCPAHTQGSLPHGASERKKKAAEAADNKASGA
jgi:hypothetical protein